MVPVPVPSPKMLLYKWCVPLSPYSASVVPLRRNAAGIFLASLFLGLFFSLFPMAVAPRGGPESGVSPGHGPRRAEGRGGQLRILSSQRMAAGKTTRLHPFMVSRAILDRQTDRHSCCDAFQPPPPFPILAARSNCRETNSALCRCRAGKWEGHHFHPLRCESDLVRVPRGSPGPGSSPLTE